ncbi:phosphohistidine phosphatase [Metarhizobium album]|uniref:Phosphohistidine phosphatase n=1 Tax=Metarhizobium album TaxID=2182425 RepID=A0A2U2DPD3_9HYPH|nr:histidine phosphatase family protein [Rhizobium album]PWE55175.1 phosphohistidine phosphatase [Rhizobium album]
MNHGRRLLLLRHAKSAWPEGVADKERPLAPRGEKAAPVMGAYLARERLNADLALVSPARRTQESWTLLRRAWPKAPGRRDIDDLYETSAETVLAVIRTLEADRRSVLILGHNPGLEDLARLLIGAGQTDDRLRLETKFPTCGLAVIDFKVKSWAKLAPGSGTLERFVMPKMLG